MSEPSNDHLTSVSEAAAIGEANVRLTDEPAWVTLRGTPGRHYTVSFATRFLPQPRHTSAVILVRIPGDRAERQNEWGRVSPEFGRHRFVPHPKEQGPATFSIRWPDQSEIRLGFRDNGHRGEALISREVLFVEENGAGTAVGSAQDRKTAQESEGEASVGYVKLEATEREGGSVQVYMNPAEAALLDSYLGQAAVYLEFGSGGSTLAALNAKPKRIVSVEADRGWIARLQQEPTVKDALRRGRLRFVPADIGEIGSWSIPVDRTAPRPEWRRYALGPWQHLSEPPDLVLIDGRFRLACIITSLLACRPGTPILVHDWDRSDARREPYFRALDVAEQSDSADNLVVLRRSAEFDPVRCLALLNEAWDDYR